MSYDDSLNEKNFKVGATATAVVVGLLIAGSVTAGTISSVSGDQSQTVRYQLGIACVQNGGEWRDHDADCLKK